MTEIESASKCVAPPCPCPPEPPCGSTPKKSCGKPAPCATPHAHCVTKEKFPCCDDDESPFNSEDEDECKKKSEKRGFPLCCLKKPAVESSANIKVASATSMCPENAKKCQTAADDFKLAQEYYKKALANEKKRQKLYSRQNVRVSSRCANMRAQYEKLSEKEREKVEAEYKKAKTIYRQRRKKMEAKALKSLDKELKKIKAEC